MSSNSREIANCGLCFIIMSRSLLGIIINIIFIIIIAIIVIIITKKEKHTLFRPCWVDNLGHCLDHGQRTHAGMRSYP